MPSDPAAPEGVDAALVAAARRLEESTGATWDVARVRTADEEPEPAPMAEIARQRYAGVFLRTQAASRYPRLDHVPMCGFHIEFPRGSHVVQIGEQPGIVDETMRLLFSDCRAAGCSVPLVLDTSEALRFADVPQVEAEREERTRRIAAETGVAIPPDGYQTLSFKRPRQARRIVRLALSAGSFDSVVALDDNFPPIVCEELVARFGSAREAARHFRIFSAGSFPSTVATALPVTWHGEDVEATLLSFVRWCDAIHDCAATPPPPALVRR